MYQVSPHPKPVWTWIEYDVKSNPHNADIDIDGKNDRHEKLAKTDPNRANTDCDGHWDTNDGFEIDWGLNPLDFDTDSDGLSDGLEIDLWIQVAGYSPDEPEKVPHEVLGWVVTKINNPVIPSFIDIAPETLNLNNKGKWITCYIELPKGYDVGNIDVSTLWLNDTVLAELEPIEIGDYDDDGIAELMVKFDRRAAIAYLQDMGIENNDELELTITGKVAGIPLEGNDTIRVIDKGCSWGLKSNGTKTYAKEYRTSPMACLMA